VRIHAIFGGIGAFAVKFRWVVIAAWLIAGFAVPKFLPSLSSVTQGNNPVVLAARAGKAPSRTPNPPRRGPANQV
jgi:uncharacterized membrane protein YdfJ with MMPL/SSD domain